MRFQVNRRNFVKGMVVGAGVLGSRSFLGAQVPQGSQVTPHSRRQRSMAANPKVGLIKGNDRRANMLKALEMIAPQIREGVKGKQVVIKPNFTRVGKQDALASTHVDNVSALCEVLSSFYNGKIIIAEGTGPGTPLQEALDSYEYVKLRDRYKVEFLDLRSDKQIETFILDKDLAPVRLRASSLLLDPNSYIVSAAVLKTHSLAVVTLGLKNVVMAAPINQSTTETNDRRKMHADVPRSGPKPYNFNLFQLATHVAPDLVMIDGFVGMEGEGPIRGTPVESNVAVASTDWLAADRVGTELMGFDFSKIGHLRYCAQVQMGTAELSKIEVAGDSIGNCKRSYKPPANLESVLM